MQSENIEKLMEAMNRAQLAMVPAKKDSENPFFHSKYADLATVWDALAPFRQENLVFTQCPAESPDGYILLDTQVTHTSGQWISSRLKMKVAKDDPQGYGSAITYARRYALGAMTGLVTEVDDDGNAASHAKPAPQPFKLTPPAQPPAQATKSSPEPTAAQESAFAWKAGKLHMGKGIDTIPLDYLEWYLSDKNKFPWADHVAAAKAELGRVACSPEVNQPKISALCDAYLENISVSETVSECQKAMESALSDENINVFEQTHLKETAERKLALLRG